MSKSERWEPPPSSTTGRLPAGGSEPDVFISSPSAAAVSMADAGFFRGTTSDQDNRFSDKEKKLLKTMKYEESITLKVCGV